MFYLQLLTDMLHLCVYLVFFVIVFTNYGLPLHLVTPSCLPHYHPVLMLYGAACVNGLMLYVAASMNGLSSMLHACMNGLMLYVACLNKC